MDLHKSFDCTIGGCMAVAGFFTDTSLGHFAAAGGALLVGWRCIQAFVLEPMGIFWPRPRDARRRRR